MLKLFSPILFISYSRTDKGLVESLAQSFKQHGFRIFLDTSDIDPGDNFVAKLSKELRRATAIVPIISENYSRSRWAQAELYQALTTNKMVIPVLVGNGEISSLDDPLERLLRDIQYVPIDKDLSNNATNVSLLTRLSDARKKYKIDIFKKSIPYLLGALLLIALSWWAVGNINYIKQAQTRKDAINKVQRTSKVLQHDSVVQLASEIAGDRVAVGEFIFLSQDPAQSNVSRFNAIALGSELRKGQDEYRWYINKLPLSKTKLENTHFVNTSFIDGNWNGVEFINSVFANVVWSQNEKFSFSMSGTKFDNSFFVGSEFYDIIALFTEFKNCKFIGSKLDTTNFSKVKIFTENPETEGNLAITPYYAKFDKSIVVSDRSPPEEGVLDLTMTGDDVVFDDVLFIDTRFEGWFKPEWFRNSTFRNCEFSDGLSKKSLENAGNIVQ